MNLKKSLLACASLVGMLTAMAGQAHAALIPVLVGGAPSYSGGVYTYTYDVSLSTDSKVDTSLNPAFLTFYDFNGYIMNTAAVTSSNASNFNITQQAFGVNAFGTSPMDTITGNITFNYNGPVVTGPSNPFFVVTLESTQGLASSAATTEYTGQSTATSNNTIQGNIGLTLGPSAVSNTPEPGSIAMLLSFTGGGILMLRKRRA